jgi:PmbA protein
MSELLSADDCHRLLDLAASAARRLGVGDVELLIGASAEALTRFANNAIHQNVAERGRWVSVRVQEGRRTARATTNRFDPVPVRRAVEDAVAAMRAAAPDESLLAMADPRPVEALDRRDEATALTTPEDRARRVADAIAIAAAASQTAAGIYATEEHAQAVAGTSGVFALYRETMARFSITSMTADSSGWAKATATSSSAIDPEALTRGAVEKAARSRAPREIPPGKYTAILEPSAVLDLVGQIFADFSGTALDDQRSFLNGRLGKRIFGSNISIHDDVRHPLQCGAPFDGEGLPRTRLTLVEAGTPRDLPRSRANAVRHSVEPTGHGLPLPNEAGEAVANVVMSGGDGTLDRMIASTPRGILVTRIWYIREVDPYDKIMTGMTRDGTFLIEDGAIACGVRNFRFNVGVVDLLNRVEALSGAVRASGEDAMDMVVPAMKVADFPFTEVTRF